MEYLEGRKIGKIWREGRFGGKEDLEGRTFCPCLKSNLLMKTTFCFVLQIVVEAKPNQYTE